MKIYTCFNTCRFFKEQMFKYLLYRSDLFLQQFRGCVLALYQLCQNNVIFPIIFRARIRFATTLFSLFYSLLYPYRSNYLCASQPSTCHVYSFQFSRLFPWLDSSWCDQVLVQLWHTQFLKFPRANYNHGMISPFVVFFCPSLPLPLMSA